MSKRYQRNEDNTERLEKENRDLKREVRQLHKRLRKLTKGYKRYVENDVFEIEEPLEKTEEKVCFECSRGVLVVKTVLNRRWRECNVCSKRTKVKIIE